MNRRRFLIRTSAGLAAVVSDSCSREAAPDSAGAKIERLMMRLHDRRMFAGAILVAVEGEVVYQGGFGAADLETGRPFTTRTQSCLASLSKPITAVAVMMLVQARLLSYDDPLSNYLPGFTDTVGAATLRQLLTHTSGIPDYAQLHVDRPGVTNIEILGALRKLPHPSFPPGQQYEYSNSGYVLLALVIEAVSGRPLPQFLGDRIFKPLGMSATFVLTSQEQKIADVARGYDRKTGRIDDFEGMATGETGVYSTVGDLLRFDQAIYGDTLVSQSVLAEAFVPAAVRVGTSTYGFGWNVIRDADGLRTWHQGNTAGFRAFMERRLRDRITVIMLTNGGDTDRRGINAEIQRILRQG